MQPLAPKNRPFKNSVFMQFIKLVYILLFAAIHTLATPQQHQHTTEGFIQINRNLDLGSQAEQLINTHFSYSVVLEKLSVLSGDPIEKIQSEYDDFIKTKLNIFKRKFVCDYKNGLYPTDHDIEKFIIKSSMKMLEIYRILKNGDYNSFNENKLHKENNLTLKAANGPCLNPDMETCDFTDWDLTTGTHDGSAPFAYAFVTPTTSWSVFSGTSSSDQHYIVNAASGNDQFGFPMLNPDGGVCSAMLGDYTGTGALASSMRKTFLVSGNNSVFVINYAAVLENPSGHLPNEMPYFRIRVYDQNNNELSCGTVNVYSGDGQPGWNVSGSGGIQWKPWTTLFVPLTGYQNQNVTVEFTVGDCSLSGHYGYAYVEASCQPAMIQLAAGSTVCSDSVVVTGPPGAAGYLWNTGDTTQQITITQSGYYAVTVTPLTGANCTVTLDTNIYINTAPPVSSFTHNAPQCLGRGAVSFYNQSYPGDTAMPIINWVWDFGDGNIITDTAQLNHDHIYADSGNYEVSLIVTALNGCKDTLNTSIYIEEPYKLFIPNVFSPNSDNVNDYFKVLTGCINELVVDIYDRWGNYVYGYNDKNGKWDGLRDNKKADDGVYYYIVKVTDRDNVMQVYTGTVTLIR
jgi:gliding motility-associated-like protein